MPLVLKWGPRIARVVLGLMFVVFGLNYFLEFLGANPPPPERAAPFILGLVSAGYVFPVIKMIEVASGLALIGNRFVPLALTLLAPIIVNIAAVHILLVPMYPMVVILLSLEIYLTWTYRSAFAPMLQARVAPAGASVEASSSSRVPGTASVKPT